MSNKSRQNKNKSWFNIVAKEDAPTVVNIYDEIGFWGITAKDFNEQIKSLGDIDLYIHSPGGDVADGLAIYDMLKRHNGKVTAYVETLAASMASVIALAADEVKISSNGFFMIHNAWTIGMGDADDLEKMAQDMRKWENKLVDIYVEATGMDEEEIRQKMADETWIDANDAVEWGFADSSYKATKAAASIKDFKGELANKILGNSHGVDSLQNKSKSNQKNMEKNDNKDLLDLQAKATKAQADFEKEVEKREASDKALESAVANHAKEIEAVRKSASEIVALGKSHGQLELAVKAIAEGTSIEDFKTELLNSYEDGNKAKPVSESDIKGEVLDPEEKPKNRADFLATYESLKGATANAYFNKFKSVLKGE